MSFTVHDLIQRLVYYQPVEIWRTNDYMEDRLVFKGIKQDLITNMDDDLFSDLKLNVLVIETTHYGLLVKAQDEYFFRSDDWRCEKDEL